MPKAAKPSPGLVDSWGRANNRKHIDKTCGHCGTLFRPKRAESRYCSRNCSWANNGGHNKKDESWWVNGRGYVEGRITIDGRQIRVKQHRLVAEMMIGRPLQPDEDVHHKNGDKTDNRPENLEVISHAAHSAEHNRSRTYRRGYTLHLSEQERERRSRAMKAMRQAALSKATGASHE